MNFHGYGTLEIRRILENMKYFLTPKNRSIRKSTIFDASNQRFDRFLRISMAQKSKIFVSCQNSVNFDATNMYCLLASFRKHNLSNL